jgi:hypothetical protein
MLLIPICPETYFRYRPVRLKHTPANTNLRVTAPHRPYIAAWHILLGAGLRWE